MGHKRIVDLSISIEPNLPSDPPMMIPKIDYINHEKGAEQMKEFYPGVNKEHLPGGLGWALEFITLTTHSGTHLDAPYHYHPTMDKGKRAMTIDEIPLDWCFNDGVVLDFRHKADGERISVKDVRKELQRIKYEIMPMDIVLIQTGADDAWGTEQYLMKGAGMDRESTLFLTEKGVKVVGIDAWSWDRPLPFQAKEFKETGRSLKKPEIPGSSGRHILQVLTSDTAIWRKWPTWRQSENLLGLQYAVSRSKLKAPAPDGRGRLRSLMKSDRNW